MFLLLHGCNMSNLLSFLFLRLSAYITLNWGPRGIRELVQEANKVEVLNILSSFSKSVTTTFVTHCRCNISNTRDTVLSDV